MLAVPRGHVHGVGALGDARKHLAAGVQAPAEVSVPTMPSSEGQTWTCPKCGARLVTRNLWHSCGQFTLEALFSRSEPAVLRLARRFIRMLRSLGDAQVIPQKTRLVCV